MPEKPERVGGKDHFCYSWPADCQRRLTAFSARAANLWIELTSRVKGV